MPTPRAHCPAWLLAFYKAALYLYPASFQKDYRELMLQAFADNYQHQQKSSSVLFLLETIGDLGNSMSQEHFSDFLKHGRTRIAILGLCFALGFLALRPLLTESLTDGFVSLAKTDDKISEFILQDYYRHSEKIASDLLDSDDPLKVMAGAHFAREWRSEIFLGLADAKIIDLKIPVNEALEKASRNSVVWIAAYPICVQDASICDANKVLTHLRKIAPDNGMTWLYSASEARESGDVEMQEIYLKKASTTVFFDDANNALNARWYYAHAETPYKLPWYNGFASRNLSKLESSVMGFDNYSIPGCKDAEKAVASILDSCLKITKKIALQSTSSLSLKLRATLVAAKLGDTDSNARLEFLREQNSGYYYYLYTSENKDVAALADAYKQERQYVFAAEKAAANKQEKYPDAYEF